MMSMKAQRLALLQNHFTGDSTVISHEKVGDQNQQYAEIIEHCP